ncbi:hypothetical protein QJS10_CPB19g00960 [Acorus calamus]|uniref:Uncharacterized protein n=1 Tax=Acorus calamus TaxID=4465 RepID=A0AAV9CIN2_ACOCL|nr:hypothetical protein QJS10_CPB19g00960 [Acorus calamus]
MEEEDTTEIPVPQSESLPEEATDTSDEEADEEEVDVEICESVDSYYFRVPVPGVERAAGPVDPRKFTGHFSDDGIFEAFVMKNKEAD